jgi:hypothetical protein
MQKESESENETQNENESESESESESDGGDGGGVFVASVRVFGPSLKKQTKPERLGSYRCRCFAC